MSLKKVSLGIFSLLLMASCGSKQEQAEAPLMEYKTMVLSEQNATLETSYAATIKGQEDIEIRPRIDGFIDAIYVDEGSVVKKGQTLFKINSPTADQNIRTSKAQVESAKAAAKTAEINVTSLRPLAAKGIISNTQLQTAENSYATAMASVAQAEAALTNAQAMLGWTNVSSPVDGIVGAIPFRQGSLVNNSNTLTTVANTKNVYVYFSLNEKDLFNLLNKLDGNTQAEKIKNMPEVSLVLANGDKYPEKGKISTITGQVNVSTGSVNMRADFPNKDGLLRSGFSGKVIMPNYVENTFVIPQASTFKKQDKVVAYKVQGDSVVEAIISVLPLPDGQQYVVTNGLNTGDRIVTEGLATLSVGKKIIAK
ncbi:efflux RND transporter periplasmic adaptor subunit [Dysgonomonas sp. 216]|uniref:efflux RND transporter periplasmic adaptor subunit n=1 Tax=Dysgonomonas sp. 216 TaxID=2302934 RepID=UPI0013D3A9C4|nr:efflux RND transporter periplasmic adaptor subunit [Dysgonomonas sp. 216]NDW18893.1 efflux RND transporter periplasmic adaptor subunit [Dysgonomonas sp. 216]